MLQIRLILILSLISSFCYAQQKETLRSPRKASLYSILPGAGQLYNKKYWKIPIIYAGIGTSLYAAKKNNDNYLTYLNALNSRSDNEGETDQFENYSDSQLITIKNYYRKNRDLSYIIAVGIYLFSIVDATVDAHLFNFNVSDDLSLHIAPPINMEMQQELPLISLKFNL